MIRPIWIERTTETEISDPLPFQFMPVLDSDADDAVAVAIMIIGLRPYSDYSMMIEYELDQYKGTLFASTYSNRIGALSVPLSD